MDNDMTPEVPDEIEIEQLVDSLELRPISPTCHHPAADNGDRS